MKIDKHLYECARAMQQNLTLLKYRLLGRKNIVLCKTVRFGTSPNLYAATSIDSYTNIGGKVTTKGANPVKIGKYCSLGSDITIISSNHVTSKINMECRLQHRCFGDKIMNRDNKGVTIGNAVWIGDRVTILPGVTIGNGAIIGAGAVVSKDIPAYRVAVGNPAIVKKKRFGEDTIAVLETVEWWHWSEDRIKQNKEFFESDLDTLPHHEVKRLVSELK